MKKQPDNVDRNFDDLAERFRRNVYGGLKGDIRLAVLQRDLQQHIPQLYAQDAPPLHVLDAGGGQGQFSLTLVSRGHKLAMCDISSEMLAMARQAAEERGINHIQFYHQSIQAMAAEQPLFDLVLCHAVLEWVTDPQSLLDDVVKMVKPGGYLSLTFFNINSIAIKNLLRGNFNKVLSADYTGYRGSLTPTNPLDPNHVQCWIAQLPMTVIEYSGIRCFHDYLLDPDIRQQNPAIQQQMEIQLSRQEPFRSMARYQHLLLQKQH